MNASRYIVSILAAVFVWLLPLCGLAQNEPPADLGYPPPPGWEYVRNLDSLNLVFYPHNDSIFIGTQNNIKGTEYLVAHSTDGGKNWASSTFPENHKKFYWGIPGWIKGTSILHYYFIDPKDSSHYLIVSTDLGQTWNDRTKMNDFVKDIKEMNQEAQSVIISSKDVIISDIHYPEKNWFIKYNELYFGIDYIYNSVDGGISWSPLQIPVPSSHLSITRLNFDIKFDYREPGAWYFASRRIYVPRFYPVDGDYDTVTGYYVSRDQGKTYKQIPVLGDYVGVTDYAEHFLWTGPKENAITGYKVIDSNLIERKVELLQQLTPDKFPLDTSKGYGYSIGLNSTFFAPNPDQLLLAVGEGRYDGSKDTVYFANGWLYFSKDQKKFEEILYASNLPRLSSTFVDQKSGTVWLKTIDTLVTKSHNSAIYHQSLWKRKVFTPTSTVVGNGAAENISPTTSIIYGQTSPPTLIIRQPKTAHTRIALYDILGKELAVIFDGALAIGDYRFRLWEATGLSTQTLFVRIEQADWSKTEKIVISH